MELIEADNINPLVAKGLVKLGKWSYEFRALQRIHEIVN